MATPKAKTYNRVCPRCKQTHETTTKGPAICEGCKIPSGNKTMNPRTIYFQKRSSKKTEVNLDTGEKEFEIYDCRIKVDDKEKLITWMDCSCWNFQNKRIQKIGKVQDIKFVATPCKHLESVVNALKFQGNKLKEITAYQGLDKCTPQLRKQILIIYKNTCAVQDCEETIELEIHRRTPGVNGGKYSISNCEPLCKEHHKLITFQRYRDLK